MPSVVRTISYGSVKVFWLDRDEAQRRLREAAARLVAERPEVDAVYLFGSLAEGRAVPGSDADILILLERSEDRWLDRPLAYRPLFDGVDLPVDLFCYTRDEYHTSRFARESRKAALLLAGRTGRS